MAPFYVALGILGAFCIIAAASNGKLRPEVAGHKLPASPPLSNPERVMLLVVGVVFFAVAVVMPQIKPGRASPTTAGPTAGPPVGTTPTPVTTVLPAHPVYLRHLRPQSGDEPTRGDTQIGDRDFPNSIFYKDVPSNESNASACQHVADPTCRGTGYTLAAARYHRFSGMLGVTGCPDDTATWSLIVDGDVVRTHTVPIDNAPHRVSVALPHGNDLELVVSSSGFSGAACGSVDIVWGDARLS